MGGCNLCALLHFPTVYTQSGDSDNHNQNSSDAPSRCLQRCFCPPWWNRGGSEDQSVPVHLFATICRTQLTHSWLARLENDASHCCVLAILNLSLLNFDDVFSNTSDLILTWLDSDHKARWHVIIIITLRKWCMLTAVLFWKEKWSKCISSVFCLSQTKTVNTSCTYFQIVTKWIHQLAQRFPAWASGRPQEVARWI